MIKLIHIPAIPDTAGSPNPRKRERNRRLRQFNRVTPAVDSNSRVAWLLYAYIVGPRYVCCLANIGSSRIAVVIRSADEWLRFLERAVIASTCEIDHIDSTNPGGLATR